MDSRNSFDILFSDWSLHHREYYCCFKTFPQHLVSWLKFNCPKFLSHHKIRCYTTTSFNLRNMSLLSLTHQQFYAVIFFSSRPSLQCIHHVLVLPVFIQFYYFTDERKPLAGHKPWSQEDLYFSPRGLSVWSNQTWKHFMGKIILSLSPLFYKVAVVDSEAM